MIRQSGLLWQDRSRAMKWFSHSWPIDLIEIWCDVRGEPIQSVVGEICHHSEYAFTIRLASCDDLKEVDPEISSDNCLQTSEFGDKLLVTTWFAVCSDSKIVFAGVVGDVSFVEIGLSRHAATRSLA